MQRYEVGRGRMSGLMRMPEVWGVQSGKGKNEK